MDMREENPMANTRLTVVVRKDLQMPPGLLAAQVCHMADAFMRTKINQRFMVVSEKGMPETPLNSPPDTKTCSDLFQPEELSWMQQPYLSVLAVNCYEDLLVIKEHAVREALPIQCWNDIVPSPTLSDNSIKAFVGVAIGPADFDKIKIVTGSLEAY